MQKLLIIFFLLIGLQSVHAQEASIIPDIETTYLSRVTKVLDVRDETVPNTGVKEELQRIEVVILNKDKIGKTIKIDDDRFHTSIGDKLYIRYLKTGDGTEYYSALEPDRTTLVLGLIILFVLVTIVFGGMKGVRSLCALLISFGAVFTMLFPALLHTIHPIGIAIAIGVGTLFVLMFITHGFTRVTLAAFLGCLAAVVVTGLLGYASVLFGHISGFADEESVYLNLATGGHLNFQALLVAAIILGAVGVVDDIAITQTQVVQELVNAGNLSRQHIWESAMKVGREHSGALINTLILAYAGASLSTVLLMYTSDTPIIELISREQITTEIIRMLTGTIGLVLLVPLSTLTALLLVRKGASTGSSHHH